MWNNNGTVPDSQLYIGNYTIEIYNRKFKTQHIVWIGCMAICEPIFHNQLLNVWEINLQAQLTWMQYLRFTYRC